LKNSGRVVAHFSVSHTVSITERRISKKRKAWEIHMLPLLFILIVTGLSILVSCLVSDEITWFTYYIGAMAGQLISGIALDLWNRRSRRDTSETVRREI
jgi:hypothetical protein